MATTGRKRHRSRTSIRNSTGSCCARNLPSSVSPRPAGDGAFAQKMSTRFGVDVGSSGFAVRHGGQPRSTTARHSTGFHRTVIGFSDVSTGDQVCTSGGPVFTLAGDTQVRVTGMIQGEEGGWTNCAGVHDDGPDKCSAWVLFTSMRVISSTLGDPLVTG